MTFRGVITFFSQLRFAPSALLMQKYVLNASTRPHFAGLRFLLREAELFIDEVLQRVRLFEIIVRELAIFDISGGQVIQSRSSIHSYELVHLGFRQGKHRNDARPGADGHDLRLVVDVVKSGAIRSVDANFGHKPIPGVAPELVRPTIWTIDFAHGHDFDVKVNRILVR